MILPASGIIKALPHVPTDIKVEYFCKTLTALPKGLLTGVGTDFPESIVRLDQTAINPDKKKPEMNDMPVTGTVAAIQYREKELQDD